MSERTGSGKKASSPVTKRRNASPKAQGRQRTKKSQSPARKGSASQSPARKGSAGRVQSAEGSELKSAMRKGSGDKKKKHAMLRSPDLTETGLKKVDLSGQGMTVVPPSIVTARDIAELSMAANNLRSLPVEIGKLVTLTKLDLSRNGIRCTNPQDFSGLPAELAELVNMVELKISECNLPYVPPAIWKITSLQVLDISRNKINILLPEVGELVNLKKINLQQTNITTLPPEIAFCQDLEEILLWGNVITSLPETLPEMLKLKRLAVNYRNFCIGMENYNENLLRKGQIKSEHIPVVLFELSTLEVLDLEETKINNLPDVGNLGLQEFYLSRNFLQAVPSSIFNLNHLTILDLSENLLSNVSEDIGRIQSLVVLKLNKNTIERIPISIGKLTQLRELNLAENKIRHIPNAIKGLVNLKALHVEKNNLTQLPEEICMLENLETLDITENRITALPMKMHQLKNITVAHSYQRLSKYGLWLYKNPLVQPPPEIWKTERPEKIFEYLKKLAIIKTENLQRQKMLVFGESGCGKTSLINALIHRKSMLTDKIADTTRGIAQTPWRTANNVEFMINDFGGENAYKMMHPLFLDSKAMIVLVYNHSNYVADCHYEAIGQWLDFFNLYMPGAVVKLVGTHLDHYIPDPDTDDEEELDVEINIGLDVAASAGYDLGDAAEEDENGNLPMPPLENLDVDQDDGGNDSEGPTSSASPYSHRTSTPQDGHSKSKLVEDLVSMQIERQMEIYKDRLEKQLQLVEDQVRSFMKGTPEVFSSSPQYKHLLTQKKKLEHLLKNPIRIMPDIKVVSSSEGLKEISRFIESLELLAIDKKLFPHAQRSIPDKWNQLRAALKQKNAYFLTWKQVEVIAANYGIKDELLFDCLQYFHDIGEILWFRDIPSLSDVIFHKPRVLVDILSALFRHDLDKFLDYDANKVFMSKGNFDSDNFETAKTLFHQNGQISRPLLNCFWFFEHLNQDKFDDLLDLAPRLQICFSVPENGTCKGSFYRTPLLVLPWYNSESAGTDLETQWNNLTKTDTDKSAVQSVTYEFPLGLPDGLFERLLCIINELVLTRSDWKDAVYGTTAKDYFLLRKVQSDLSLGTSISLKVLSKTSDEQNQDLFFLKQLTREITDIFLKTPGLVWSIVASDNIWKSHALSYDFKAVQFDG